MNKKTGLEVVTRQDLQNLTTSVILRKKKFTEKEILEEILKQLEVKENYVWILSEERVKECVKNTIETLYLNGTFRIEGEKYVMKRNVFLD